MHVTLASADKQVEAHKFILDVLSLLLTSGMKERNTAMEKKINLTEVKELLTLADRPECDGITTRAAALKDGLGVYKVALEKVGGYSPR